MLLDAPVLEVPVVEDKEENLAQTHKMETQPMAAAEAVVHQIILLVEDLHPMVEAVE
jgi:hypothetical protein